MTALAITLVLAHCHSRGPSHVREQVLGSPLLPLLGSQSRRLDSRRRLDLAHPQLQGLGPLPLLGLARQQQQVRHVRVGGAAAREGLSVGMRASTDGWRCSLLGSNGMARTRTGIYPLESHGLSPAGAFGSPVPAGAGFVAAASPGGGFSNFASQSSGFGAAAAQSGGFAAFGGSPAGFAAAAQPGGFGGRVCAQKLDWLQEIAS